MRHRDMIEPEAMANFLMAEATSADPRNRETVVIGGEPYTKTEILMRAAEIIRQK